MSNDMKKKILIGLGVLIVILIGVFFITSGKGDSNDNKGSNGKKGNNNSGNNNNNGNGGTEIVEKVDIIDINSNTRPFAVVVNNTPIAIQVQEGLNKAYIVYELPTEGATSRLIALFKDVDDVTIGTIRSVRHNFIDFAYESNAILVGYGWSHYAQAELQGGGIINNMNGMVDDYPYWRNNPEGLASEHTAYTNTKKIREYAQQKGFSLTGDNTILFKYNAGDVDLSGKNGAIQANAVSVPYGSNFTYFGYDANAKNYIKFVNGNRIVDHATGESITTKNIIIEKINYSVTDDGYYWDLYDVGSGDGYFITNGYAVPIKWNKPSRAAKTTYTYLDGSEIEVSDGRTYIEVQVNSQPLTIE